MTTGSPTTVLELLRLADTSRQLDIFWHDCDSLSMDRTQIGVLEQPNQIRFRSFLQGEQGVRLKSDVALVVLGYLAHEALERKLADQEIGGSLQLANLSQSESARPVAARFLHTRRVTRLGLTCRLGGQHFAGSLASGGLARGLLSSGHGAEECRGAEVVVCAWWLGSLVRVCGRNFIKILKFWNSGIMGSHNFFLANR